MEIGDKSGVLEDGDKKIFDDYVKKKCPFYFDLYNILHKRDGVSPIVNTDNIFYNRVNDKYDSNTTKCLLPLVSISSIDPFHALIFVSHILLMSISYVRLYP